jgi:hypothetical protein
VERASLFKTYLKVFVSGSSGSPQFGRAVVSYGLSPTTEYSLLELFLYVFGFVAIILIFFYIASERPAEKKKKEEEED